MRLPSVSFLNMCNNGVLKDMSMPQTLVRRHYGPGKMGISEGE